MNLEKFIILLKRLDDKAAELEWQVTVDERSFQTTVSQYALRISEQPPDDPDPESAPDYILSVYNQQGDVIESVSDVELAAFDRDSKAFQTMKKIYKIARSAALGLDRALDSIIDALKEELPW